MFSRCLARIQQVDTIVRGDGPVVVLSGAVHTGKGLFMKQALHSVLAGHLLQGLHHNLVLIHCHIGHRVDGSQLMLSRSHLVVLSLGSHAQFPQLRIYLAHESRHSLPNSTEIMVIQLLPLGRHSSKQGPSGINQVFSLFKLLRVHQEILLLRSHRGGHLL